MNIFQLCLPLKRLLHIRIICLLSLFVIDNILIIFSRNSFSEILEHDIFVNCVLSDTKTVKFLKKSDITDKRELSLISDVSCDPGSDFNTIPLYDKPSSFKKPYQYINRGKNPLLLTAIDNLPAMLPKESSIDFEKQLLPYLLDFDVDKNGVWGRAKRIFYDKINTV